LASVGHCAHTSIHVVGQSAPTFTELQNYAKSSGWNGFHYPSLRLPPNSQSHSSIFHAC